MAANSSEAGSGLAVNGVSGDVYVADTGNNRIDQFSATGVFSRAFGWGVLDGAAELQSCTTLTGCQAALAGTEPGELDAPAFIAIDNAPGGEGDVYVANTGAPNEADDNLITKFDAEGNLLAGWGLGGQLDGSGAANGGTFGQPTGLGVDASGDLWVYVGGSAHAGNVHMFEFSRAGDFITESEPEHVNAGAPSPQGIAFDASADFYVSMNARTVEKLTPSGTWLGTVYGTPFTGPERQQSITALTSDPDSGDLYVDEGSSIQALPGACAPSKAATLSCTPTQTLGSPQLSEAAGLALGPDGTLYAANTGAAQIALFAVSLEATAAPPTGVQATSATLNGEVNPESGEITRCFFRLGRTTSYGRILPCLNAAGEEVGTEAQPITAATPVHAAAEELEGGSTYHYTLRAFNSGEERVTSEDEAFETSPIPLITETRSTEVTASSATLDAQINPEGLVVTNCEIEWGASTTYGNDLPCEPPTLPAGSAPLPISAQLEGLSPDTTYHWRVIAANTNGTSTGSDNTFVFSTEKPGSPTGSCANESLRQANRSLALPDCRAYELVTPPQKNGALFASVAFGLGPSLAADGSRILAPTLQCFDGAQSCTGDRLTKGPPFEMSRTERGWTTTPLAPPASQFEINSVWSYSADTGDVLYSSPVPSGLTDQFYARRPGGAMEPIGPIGETQGFVRLSSSEYFATADLSHLLYESKVPEAAGPLWAFDSTQGEQSLYEYAGAGKSHPFLVGVRGGQESTDLVSACDTKLGSPASGAIREAVSADGRVVIFAPQQCASGLPVPSQQLWARIDGESSAARSIELSAPAASCSACAASQPEDADFQGASEDGSDALFTSTQQLTSEAQQGSRNLYLFAQLTEQPLGGNHLLDLSAGDTSGHGPDVQGVMAVSANGSHVYFVAGGVLAGVNAEGNSPAEGADNLYVYERDAAFPAGHTTFIASLPGQGPTANGEVAEAVEWTTRADIVANVTPDGRFLLFTSHGDLTPDTAPRPEAPAQVFRYDADSERLQRVSVGRQGFNNDGNVARGEAQLALPANDRIASGRRDLSMSDDGSRVFFQSPVALTPGALDDVSVNGRTDDSALARNVYQWQAPGTGECAESSGCLALISDGEDASETSQGGSRKYYSSVNLLGTDASGENVFFSTADPLVPADTDTGYDIYDARVGGGFAPTPQPTPCQGDACKGPESQAGPQPSAATPGFDGPEEGPRHPRMPGRAKCKKGFVHRHGKCVKTPTHKKRHKQRKHANHSRGGRR